MTWDHFISLFKYVDMANMTNSTMSSIKKTINFIDKIVFSILKFFFYKV